ncbi:MULTISPECIES: hypothetical protein [Aphanothece]|uniref:hypothetical protein n=1 Tax=Aphanothece TaxID=1121 RepID=UPI003984E10D
MVLPQLLNAAERRARISAAAAAAVRDHWVTLHDGPRTVPAAPLGQELLVYRVDNGRLLADLEERLGARPDGLPKLHAEEASPRTQALLHDLLVTKARDPRGPILQELQRLAVQTEPLLVDAEGVVINGNRRLAAMRTLLDTDPERYGRFREPLVAILPPEVSRADLEYLEASLQMAPETKLAYGWVERRLKLREQHDRLGLADDWIKEAYRLGDPAQLARELGELALAEDFLETFASAPRRYSSIADAEALFVGLAAQLEGLPRRLQRPWRQLGFLLIERREGLDPALPKHFPFSPPPTPQLPALTLQRLGQDWGLGDASDEAGAPELSRSLLQELTRIARAPHRRPVRAAAVQEALDAVRLQIRQGQTPQKLLNNLRQSRKLLERLRPEQLQDQDRHHLQGELAALAAQGAVLLGPQAAPGVAASRPRPLRRSLPRRLGDWLRRRR